MTTKEGNDFSASRIRTANQFMASGREAASPNGLEYARVSDGGSVICIKRKVRVESIQCRLPTSRFDIDASDLIIIYLISNRSIASISNRDVGNYEQPNIVDGCRINFGKYIVVTIGSRYCM